MTMPANQPITQSKRSATQPPLGKSGAAASAAEIQHATQKVLSDRLAKSASSWLSSPSFGQYLARQSAPSHIAIIFTRRGTGARLLI
jgi:hypothetical protein